MGGGFAINNYNFIVPCMDENLEEVKAWVAQPSEAEMKKLARILGPLFSLIREKKIDLVVFLRDWELFVDDICDTLVNPELAKKSILAFLDRSLLTAEFFTADGEAIKKPSEDTLMMFKGSLLFTSALYRYSFKATLETEMKDFFTSLSATEFQSSLRKSQGQSMESGVLMKHD